MTIRQNIGFRAALACALMAVAACGGIKKVKQVTAVEVGGVSLNLRVADGVDVNRVDYEITGNQIDPLKGAIDLSGGRVASSAEVFGIRPGTAFKVEATAGTADGKYKCAGSATFDVLPGKITAVTVTLLCRLVDPRGSAVISTVFKFCPAITSYVIAPLSAAVGGSIDVKATVEDKDTPQPVLTWTASSGGFAAPGVAATTYTCLAPGPQTLTFKVSDGTCEDVLSLSVQCVTVSGTCGDGVVEQAKGEECDPPNNATCSAECKNLPVCGNGLVEMGEACDPPNGTSCSNQCTAL